MYEMPTTESRSCIVAICKHIFIGLLAYSLFGTIDCKNIKNPSTAVPGGYRNLRKRSPFKNTNFNSARQRFNVTLQESRSLSEDEARLLLAKNSYCMCQCCRPKLHGDDTCSSTLHMQLPSDFTCPKRFCSKILRNNCSAWNKNRCEKTCFCQKCKHRLEVSDLRCTGELEPAAGCECKGHETVDNICLPESQGVASVWVFLTKVKMNKKFVSCAMGCFCTKCNHNTLSNVFTEINIARMCEAYSAVPKHCSAPCPPCPDHSAASHARQTLQEISVLQGSHG